MNKDLLVDFATRLAAAAVAAGTPLERGVFLCLIHPPHDGPNLYVAAGVLQSRTLAAVRQSVEGIVAGMPDKPDPMPWVTVVDSSHPVLRDFAELAPGAVAPELVWYTAPPASLNALNPEALLTGVVGWIYPAWPMQAGR